MKEEFRHVLLYGAVIVLGILANISMQFIRSKQNNKELNLFSYETAAGIIVCAFSAITFGLLATLITDIPQVHWACAGIGAYLGVNGVNSIANFVLTFLRVEK